MPTNATRPATRAALKSPVSATLRRTDAAGAKSRIGTVRAKSIAASLSLSVQYACNDSALPTRPQVRRWVRAALQDSAKVTVRFVGAIEGRALNAEYRGRDYATNVLTFVYDYDAGCVGDIVVCASVVRREAAAQKKPPIAHFAHLVVHGMLHLQGFDHEAAAEASIMEARETAILAAMGFADPYASTLANPPKPPRASR